jgi:hypothetical protein
MIRIPGSTNSDIDTGTWYSTSTNTAQIKIMWKWDGKRPAINYLMRDFRNYLIQKKIDQHQYQLQRQSQRSGKKRSSFVASDDNNNNNNSISWIESNILQGQGISDYRKITIDLILASYLLNVKKYDYNTACDTIVRWLDKCAGKDL